MGICAFRENTWENTTLSYKINKCQLFPLYEEMGRGGEASLFTIRLGMERRSRAFILIVCASLGRSRSCSQSSITMSEHTMICDNCHVIWMKHIADGRSCGYEHLSAIQSWLSFREAVERNLGFQRTYQFIHFPLGKACNKYRLTERTMSAKILIWIKLGRCLIQ